MSDDLRIRHAIDEDAGALSQLICAVLYASNLADYGHDNVARVASHFSEEGVRAMISARDAVFVATIEGRIVGTTSVDLDLPAAIGRVRAFFVDASYQRRGIGAALFSRVEDHAKALDITQFTVRSSLFAVQFYKNLGFVEVRDHWDGDERTIEMRN